MHGIVAHGMRIRRRYRLRRRGILPTRIGRYGNLIYWKYGLAVPAIENVIVSVLAAVAERGNGGSLAAFSLLRDWKQHDGLRTVVIPEVMMGLLEMPARLSSGDIKGNDGGCIEVVAHSVDTVDVGTRVAGIDVEQLQRGIDRGRIPNRCPTREKGVPGPTAS